MSGIVETDPDVRAAYASDASGLRQLPEGVCRPDTVADVVDLLRHARSDGFSVTATGAQTSTTGASVADSGVVMSMCGMNSILEFEPVPGMMRVEPGALVGDIKRAAAAEGLLFAPDPTSENECTIGGAIACNASGARTLKYGATRDHVRAITVVLASGEVVKFRRSELEKNTTGYGLVQNPIDWFIGSEGTLGVIVEAELALLPRPEMVFGAGVPFRSEADALAFVSAARTSRDAGRAARSSTGAFDPRCLEFLDHKALAIAQTVDDARGWADGATSMVYLEEETTEESADEVMERWVALAESHGALDDIRAFSTEPELRHIRKMRHAVPATMNERGARYVDQGGRKVSTDWAVPYRSLQIAIETARRLARDAGIDQAVIYGHAGNGHPHQNYIAEDASQLERIEAVIGQTLEMVMVMGGTVSAEHGIGKLKRRWLPMQLSPLAIGVMRAVKKELDPLGILAPGNIF